MTALPEAQVGEPPARAATPRVRLLGFLPLVVWQLFLFGVPLALLVCAGFWRVERGQLAVEWTLDNYREVLFRASNWDAWYESLKLTVVVVLIATTLGFLTAYAVTFVVPSHWQTAVLIAFLAPLWTNYLIRAFSWSVALSPAGPASYLARQLRLSDDPVQLLYTPTATRLGLIHAVTTLATLIIYSRMQALERSIVEAANVLGASAWRTLVNVVLPLTSAAIKSAMSLLIVFTFADYVSPAVLGGQNPRVYTQLIVDAITRAGNWSLASAYAAVLVATIGVLVAVVTLFPGPKARDLR
jgi:spermidine/putrescine transport system permease protein